MTLYSLVDAFKLGRHHPSEETELDEMMVDSDCIDRFSASEGAAYVLGMATRAPVCVVEALYNEGKDLLADFQRRYRS